LQKSGTNSILLLQAFAILEQDTFELKERLKDEEGTPEICFTEQAVEILEQRKHFLESNVTKLA
jgi:hypothetical protein